MNVYLEMPKYASPALRARIGYAFRLFCAIYGHRPILDAGDSARWDAAIRYRDADARASIADARTVWLCRGLRERDPRQPAPPPVKYARNGCATVLHFAPAWSKAPDWLGEIFEWVSCADEYSVTERDRIGRPRFEATYMGRHGLDARTPYAAVAMRALQREICRAVPRAVEDPQAPHGIEGHAVLPTHDVDYFPAGRRHAVWRLFRNAAVSCLLNKRPGLGASQSMRALRVALAAGNDPLDQIVNLAEQELRLGFTSSFYFLTRNAHRLDAGYGISDESVWETADWLKQRGMEIGLHGSFTSLEESGMLEQERNRLKARGIEALGGRQHWLRFTIGRLISEVENAGLDYDTSIGWSTRTGFRAGACFAFPPYNFAREGPARFLEFPLAVMDQALRTPRGCDGQLFHEAAHMVAASRRLGWGGISLLWHPAAFGAGWLPSEIGNVYWKLAEERRRWRDVWLKPSAFLKMARGRYVEAGLLPDAAPAAQPFPLPALARQPNRASTEPLPATGAALSA